jgi:hypothetical protein
MHRPLPLPEPSVYDVNLAHAGNKDARSRVFAQKSRVKKRKAEILLWDASDTCVKR